MMVNDLARVFCMIEMEGLNMMDCSMICCSFRIIQLGAVIMHIL